MENEIQFDAESFSGVLNAHLTDKARKVKIQVKKGSLSPTTILFVTMWNLPTELDTCGAEMENNRITYTVAIVAPFTYKAEVLCSVFNSKLRAKTAKLDVLAKYIANHINGIVESTPPNYTHTKIG